MSNGPRDLDLGFIEAGWRARAGIERKRAILALAVSATITVIWIAYVTLSGQWGRVGDHLAAAITMIFGSFVAGSTPQGGGAVAFPVFTKGLGIGSDVARSFSLFVQTIGMGTAAAAILIRRRRVEWRAVALGLPVAVVAFLLTVYSFGDRTDPFLRPLIPSAYVRVSFTLIVVFMALITYLASRVRIREVIPQIPVMNPRTYAALVLCGALGGVASGLTGSGADVFIYLVVGVLLAVEIKVGIPTSVLIMAGVSIVGFVTLGLAEGQLAVVLEDSRVTAIGGTSVDLDAATSDIFGMWLAAIPVAAWGGPIGTWAASRLKAKHLVVFVVLLALTELVTTILLVPEVRTDPVLIAYGLIVGVVIGFSLRWIAANRQRVFKQPGVPSGRTFARHDLEVSEGYREVLVVDDEGTDSADGDNNE